MTLTQQALCILESQLAQVTVDLEKAKAQAHILLTEESWEVAIKLYVKHSSLEHQIDALKEKV